MSQDSDKLLDNMARQRRIARIDPTIYDLARECVEHFPAFIEQLLDTVAKSKRCPECATDLSGPHEDYRKTRQVKNWYIADEPFQECEEMGINIPALIEVGLKREIGKRICAVCGSLARSYNNLK